VNGLDAILNRIISDAEDRVREIEDQARSQRDQILSAAGQEADQILHAARAKAAEETAVLERRSHSSAALETRKHTLAVRQQLIDEVITRAETSLRQLAPAEKAGLYVRLLRDNADGDEEVIVPEPERDFVGKLIAELNRDLNWNLALAADSGDFATGVVLRKGLIETNLTTDQLIRGLRPELVSLAAGILFKS